MRTSVVGGAPAPRWRQRLMRLLPWHRRLAVLACIGIFCWAGSGSLHPLMSLIQVRPATAAPPQKVLALDNLRSPASVLGGAGIDHVQGLRLLQLDQEPYYQARLHGADEPRYWHARTGEEADLQARHAQLLAGHYLGSNEPMHYQGNVLAFNSEYAFINRLLPVARVDTRRENGLRLYLDLYHDRLGSVVDNRKAWFSGFFQTLHSFGWLNATGPLGVLVMLVLLLAVICAALSGLAMFFARKRKRAGVRRWHAWGGLGLAFATLSFAGSGAFHLLHKQGADPLPTDLIASFAPSDLDVAPSEAWLLPGEALFQLSLIELDGKPVWRAEGQQHAMMKSLHYLDANGQEMPSQTPRQYAAERLAYYAQALQLGAMADTSVQTGFDHEYGFVFKRLPVIKAEFADADNTSLFVDPLDGALAARVQDADRLEGWVFGYLHKWEALGALGQVAKQLAIFLLGLGHVLLALAGIFLIFRRYATESR